MNDGTRFGDEGVQSSSLTGPFWDAAARGVLVRPVCDACEASFFTPQWCCPRCLSEEWTYRESLGTGTVYSATTVYRGPDPAFPTPYVLAVVDLDEGWSMLTRLLRDGPSSESSSSALDLIGTRVRVEFTPDPVVPGRRLPTFAELASP